MSSRASMTINELRQERIIAIETSLRELNSIKSVIDNRVLDLTTDLIRQKRLLSQSKEDS